MKTLTPGERRALRAKAHHLHPFASVGHGGLTPAVLHEIDVNLLAHELIKISVAAAERDEREAILAAICNALDAAPVQHIGKVVIIFRAAPERLEPRATAKSAAHKKPQARRPRTPLPRTTSRPASSPPREKRPTDPGSRRRPLGKTGFGAAAPRGVPNAPSRRRVANPKMASATSSRHRAAASPAATAPRSLATVSGNSRRRRGRG